MFTLKHLLDCPYRLHTYIWAEVLLVKETPKAILIMFDGQKAWLPKAWIARIKPNKANGTVRLKISEYYWAKKFC